jgi:hypothetical protein
MIMTLFQAMIMTLLLALLSGIEQRIADAVSPREHNRWIVFHAYVVVTYVVSLRGSEGSLLDLEGLHKYWGKGDGSYVTIALRGKIKGEHHERCHLLPSVPVTSSGVKVLDSLERLITHKQVKGFVDGPAISDEAGRAYSSRAIDDSLHEVLEDLFEEKRTLFPDHIEGREDLRKSYQAFRTLRRTSDTRAIELKVDKDDIDVVNRWKTVERARGTWPPRPMRQHYADMSLLVKPFLRYTWAM